MLRSPPQVQIDRQTPDKWEKSFKEWAWQWPDKKIYLSSDRYAERLTNVCLNKDMHNSWKIDIFAFPSDAFLSLILKIKDRNIPMHQKIKCSHILWDWFIFKMMPFSSRREKQDMRRGTLDPGPLWATRSKWGVLVKVTIQSLQKNTQNSLSDFAGIFYQTFQEILSEFAGIFYQAFQELFIQLRMTQGANSAIMLFFCCRQFGPLMPKKAEGHPLIGPLGKPPFARKGAGGKHGLGHFFSTFACLTEEGGLKRI